MFLHRTTRLAHTELAADSILKFAEMAERRYQAKGWTEMRVYGFGWRLGGTSQESLNKGTALGGFGPVPWPSSHTWRCASGRSAAAMAAMAEWV